MSITPFLTDPLSIAELHSVVDATNRITARITVPAIYVAVAHPADIDSEDVEHFNDLISSKITGSPIGLTDIGWTTVSLLNPDTALLDVSAIVEFTFLEEDSDADVLRQVGLGDEADDLDEHLGGTF